VVLLIAALLTGLVLFQATEGPPAVLGLLLAGGVALASPRYGLLGALAALPLHGMTRSVGPLALSASETLLVMATLGTLVCWIPPIRRRPPGLRPTAFDRPIMLFLASALLSLLVTEYPRLSLRELRTLILEPIVAYYLLVAWFPAREVARPIGAFVAGAAGVALAGLVGSAFGWGLTQAEGVVRLQATYDSANHLALLLGRALPWLGAFAWLGGRWRGAALAGSGMVALALAATLSRGAWIGTAAAVVVLAVGLGRRRVAPWAAGGAALLGAAALLLFRGRETTFFRVQLWQSSLAMLRDHPVLGVGLDNFLYLYQQRYILPGALAEANLSHPHNLVLHFWLQLGLPGLVAAGWLVGRALVLARQMARRGDRFWRAVAVGAAASLTNFIVHGLIDNSYFLPDLAVVFWLTLAALEAGRRERESMRA
jgi:O-antigen ligase